MQEPIKYPHRSTEINELASALAKSQVNYKTASESKYNPFYKSKYAPFKEIVDATRPSLCANGLSVTQIIIDHEDGNKMLHTTLLHSSGQYLESKIKIVPAKNDIQGIASTVTYLKRMAYSAIVGACVGDDDDDGEEAVSAHRSPTGNNNSGNSNFSSAPVYENSSKEQVKEEKITKEQLEHYQMELEGYQEITDDLMDRLKIGRLADIPKSKHTQIMQYIQKTKQNLKEAETVKNINKS